MDDRRLANSRAANPFSNKEACMKSEGDAGAVSRRTALALGAAAASVLSIPPLHGHR
ncbi:hypothetical protein [Mesorhizobium neociceri]|uniref:Uncharacterized protein n=1 Tax=Mesorhizobium neociceri TaxID=1307853 RepID=A0A838BCW8_9HYPH|nr:hypothetical protein [Mesorhizobium neociceri]MBA1144416.1 hypothetical protein [Mesorhizobium neociceri]